VSRDRQPDRKGGPGEKKGRVGLPYQKRGAEGGGTGGLTGHPKKKFKKLFIGGLRRETIVKKKKTEGLVGKSLVTKGIWPRGQTGSLGMCPKGCRRKKGEGTGKGAGGKRRGETNCGF